jgi:hypothetical protein
VEKRHYSSPKMYNYNGSYWISILELPTHVLEEAIIEISKIHKLFI